MSWTSRLGNLGRFSPFMRSPQNSYSSGAPKVSDADFSYITADDLRERGVDGAGSVSAVADGERRRAEGFSESPTDYGDRRETDRIVLKNKRNEYAVHFSAYSIAKGELSVRDVRDAAAKKLDVRPSRVKLLHKGRNLKDDSRKARDEGLKDGSEILCTVAEVDSDEADDASSSGEDEEVDGVDGQHGGNEGTKKKRNRGKRSKRRNKREAAAQAADSRSSTPEYHRERLDVPLSQQNARTPSQSRTASPKPPPTPATPIDKINALRSKLMDLQTQVDDYIRSPPADTKQRDFDYKRLSETILTQVLLKLDGVETEGDVEARTRRKELVKETQGVLSRLDAVGKGSSS